MFAFLGIGMAELVILGLIAVGVAVVLFVVLKGAKGFVITPPVAVAIACSVIFVVCAAIAGLASARLAHGELGDDGRAYWGFILAFFGLAAVALPIGIALLAILVVVTKAANEMITGLQYIDVDVRKGRAAAAPESQGEPAPKQE